MKINLVKLVKIENQKTKNEIRRSFVFCIIIIGFILCNIAFEYQHWWQEACYRMIYTRGNFLTIYLLLYLIWLFPIVNNIFVSEIIIRYTKKIDYIFYFIKRIFKISLVYTVTFFSAELFVFFIICRKGGNKEGYSYTFLTFSFFNQLIGWIFIGSLFIVLCLLFRQSVMGLFITFLLLISTTSIVYIMEKRNPFECYYKVYDFMYYFHEQGTFFQVIKFMLYYICMIVVEQLLFYYLLLKNDFINKKRR